MEHKLTTEEQQFMLWMEEDSDVTGHSCEVPATWHQLRHDADSLGNLLRVTLQKSVELPDAAAFNTSVFKQLK